MRKTGLILSVSAVITLLVISCKETQTSSGDPTPAITFVSIKPVQFKQFTDTIELVIAYKDGDGDLGDSDPDINSLEIKDSRLTKADYYFVEPLAPLGSKISIKGNLKLKLKNMFLLGTGNVENAYLDIRIKDRAGHWSNVVKSPELTITQ